MQVVLLHCRRNECNQTFTSCNILSPLGVSGETASLCPALNPRSWAPSSAAVRLHQPFPGAGACAGGSGNRTQSVQLWPKNPHPMPNRQSLGRFTKSPNHQSGPARSQTTGETKAKRGQGCPISNAGPRKEEKHSALSRWPTFGKNLETHHGHWQGFF